MYLLKPKVIVRLRVDASAEIGLHDRYRCGN